MARVLPVKLRHRVVAAIAGGPSREQVAIQFDVSAASAIYWQQLAAQHGDTGAALIGRRSLLGRLQTGWQRVRRAFL